MISRAFSDQDLPSVPRHDLYPKDAFLFGRVPTPNVARVFLGQTLGEDLQVGEDTLLSDTEQLYAVLEFQPQVKQLQAQDQFFVAAVGISVRQV